jgi:hypothetical protein
MCKINYTTKLWRAVFLGLLITQAYNGFVVQSILSISAHWIRKSFPDLSITYSFFKVKHSFESKRLWFHKKSVHAE